MNEVGPVLLGEPIDLAALEEVAHGRRRVELAPAARRKVREARGVVDGLDRAVPPRHVYGINTGFGALSEVRISPPTCAHSSRICSALMRAASAPISRRPRSAPSCSSARR